MKALVKYAKGVGNVEIRDVKKPELPGDDWVLIKVRGAGRMWHGCARLAGQVYVMAARNAGP